MILITGSNGFVGSALCIELLKRNFNIVATVRELNKKTINSSNLKIISIGDINGETDWSEALKGVSTIIHCAARVHVMSETVSNPHKEYMDVNFHGTRRLAEQAVLHGINKFIFLSTIKVNGDETKGNYAFTNNDPVNPIGSYAISKYCAENFLLELAHKKILDIVIIRTPLIYGAGAKGNLDKISALISKGFPLPFASISNGRSLIALKNLVDILICCIDNYEANGKILLVSDGFDLSTPSLINHISKAMGHKIVLFKFPVFLLLILGFIFNKSAQVNRIVGSLRIDDSYTRELLNWHPICTVEEGIKDMVSNKNIQ